MMDPGTVVTELMADPLFQPCARRLLHDLLRDVELRETMRGAHIALENEAFPYLGFVRRGIVAAFVNAPWPVHGGVRRISVYHSFAGTTFGEIGLLDGGQTMGELSVLTSRASYALIPATAVVQLGLHDPLFMRRLAARSAQRCRTLAYRTLEYASLPVPQRIAEFLLPFAAKQNGKQLAHPLLAEVYQRDMAACAGCVKEAAARALGVLETAGAVQREHGRIVFLNRQVLHDFAHNRNDARHFGLTIRGPRERKPYYESADITKTGKRTMDAGRAG